MIELYAITGHPGPTLPEIAPFREVARGGLSAVYGPADSDRTLTAERLWHHERVVEALMQSRDLLPVRYGTCLADEDAVARALEERGEELTAALGFVRGGVEISVRVFADPDESELVTPGSARRGSDYLREKARQARAQDAAAQAVHEPLRAVARADAARPPKVERELLRSAYLVDRERVQSFARRVAELQASNQALRLLCTGPWPPYSFAQR